MKIILYGLWAAVGVVLFVSLGHTHAPLLTYILVVIWGLLGGAWSYLTGQDDGAHFRRRRR